MIGYYPEPSLVPPEEWPRGYCGRCGDEIYEGDAAAEIDGTLFHENCLSAPDKAGCGIGGAGKEALAYAGR